MEREGKRKREGENAAELCETFNIMGNKLISYNKYVNFIQFSISRNRDCSLYTLVFIVIFISQTVRYKRKNEFIRIIIY